MGIKLTKKDKEYQLSRPYSFRDLEMNLVARDQENKELKAKIYELLKEKRELIEEVAKYNKVFSEAIDNG